MPFPSQTWSQLSGCTCFCVDSIAPLRPALRTSNPPFPPTSAVLAHKNRQALESFHRFSVAVWTIWLVPCFCGMLTGIPAIDLSANAAFGAALIGADVISLALCLRGDTRRAAHRRH